MNIDRWPSSTAIQLNRGVHHRLTSSTYRQTGYDDKVPRGDDKPSNCYQPTAL